MPSAATATPPFSSVRKPSTSVVGQAERLARVRFLTRPCSRKLSRNRMAGGEPRLGTDSMYMGPFNTPISLFLPAKSIHLHGYKSNQKNCAVPAETSGFYGLRCKNFGLRSSRETRHGYEKRPCAHDLASQ